MNNNTITVTSKIKIKTPTKVTLIKEGDAYDHWVDTPDDLEATLMIADCEGYTVKWGNKIIQGD